MQNYKPLSTKQNRPCFWAFQLDSIDGEEHNTNSATIYASPNSVLDESGDSGDKVFCSITLTRAELEEIVRVLDEDIEKMRKYCPDSTFV